MTFEEKKIEQYRMYYGRQSIIPSIESINELEDFILEALKEQREEIKDWCDKRMELYHEFYGTDKHDFPLEELKEMLDLSN